MTIYTNSVNQYSVTIANGATTGTVTIPAVGANAFLIYQGKTQTKAASTPLSELANVVLTNPTTITATRNTSDASNSVTVNVIVVDPTSDLVTGVQAGTITISGATSNTATISSVNTSLSVVFYLGESTTSATLLSTSTAGVTITNATTVTANLGASGTSTVSYVVVTFASSAIKSIQQFADLFTQSSTTTDTQTITSVTTGNSMLAFGNFQESAGNVSTTCEWLTLTNSTTITATRNAAGVSTRTYYVAVIEFNSGVLNSVQRGSIDLASVASNTATISSVNTANAFCSYLNFSGNIATSASDTLWGKLALTNATTITATKATAGATTLTLGYEVVEFTNIPLNKFYSSDASVVPPLPQGNTVNPSWPLNLRIPFIPRLPDKASVVPPVPQGDIFMNVRPLNLPVPWLPRIADAPPITPAYRPNYFAPGWLLNFTLSWLPRVSDAPPVTPPYKPNFFSNVFALNFRLPWLPEISDAAPVALQYKQSVFSPYFTFTAVTILSWFSRIADAPPITPPDKPNFFSPVFALNFRLPWLPTRVSDAPPITPADKPNYFAPRWLLNLPIPWLSKIYDAPPLTPADKPTVFMPKWLLNLPIPWLPARVADAPPVIPPDKPNYFAPRWLLNLPMPWQSKVIDAAPLTLADKPNYFAPKWLLNLPIPWLSKIIDAPPLTPAAKQTTFMPQWPLNFVLRWLPEIRTAAPSSTLPPEAKTASPIFPVRIFLPWLSKVHDAPPITPADKPNMFAPFFRYAAFVGWFPRITHAEPPSRLPPDAITVLPEPDVGEGNIGKLIRLARKSRTLSPDPKNAILSVKRHNRII